MEFLSALIAVMLVQLWGSGAPLHRDGWFVQWCRWCARLPGCGAESVALPIVAVSVPVFGVLIVYYGIADQWWGLPKLAMLVIVLLYSLGRGDFRSALAAYTLAWRAGNTDNAQKILRSMDCSLPVVPGSPAVLHAQARQRFLYRGFERMFVVLFWFLLGGPTLALAYRLAFLYRHRIVARNNNLAVALADHVLAVFEWLPARALGISFVVVGNIRGGVRAWIELLGQHGWAAYNYLGTLGASVSGVGEPDAMQAKSQNEAAFIALADDELRQIQVLLNRALIFWLAVMALVQLVL